MKTVVYLILFTTLTGIYSCIFIVPDKKQSQTSLDSSSSYAAKADTVKKNVDSLAAIDSSRIDTVARAFSGKTIDTRNIRPEEIVSFAKTLMGTPYHYASTDPHVGFDCSGFITYVFHHFNIVVPRSSIDFTQVGKEVPPGQAKAGDLILFTGTDSSEKFVGHIGLIVSNEAGQVSFIHSTSGKQHGVTITPFSDYYRSRYMKTIRIFPG
ncbi:MAG: C40 family peptidase [Flavisolibacter sp.]